MTKTMLPLVLLASALTGTAQAVPVLPPVSISVDTAELAQIGTTPGTFSYTTPPPVDTGAGSGTVALGSDPSISASATNTGMFPGGSNDAGGITATVNYYIEYYIPPGTLNTPVSVLLSMGGSVTCSNSTKTGAEGSVSVAGNLFTDACGIYGSSAELTPSPITLISNDEYLVSLEVEVIANASGSGGSTSAAATLDPTFTAEGPPGLPPGGLFIFSAGIENPSGTPPTVPEPTSLALLGIVLAGMGFVRRRDPRG